LSAGLWRRRRSRAIELLSSAPHADEMLEFYVGLVELQEAVADEVSRAGEGFAVHGAEGSVMQLEQLPADAIEPLFADFLLGVEPIGTVVIAGAARALLDCDAAERAQMLRTFWLQRSPADFLPRAFTEGLACFMAGRDAAAPADGHVQAKGGQSEDGPPTDGERGASALQMRCPVCGSPPQASVLRDDPGALGRRLLVCSLCATDWAFPRLTCAHCGSVDADLLHLHEVESIPHVRIEECAACTRYIKAVDLRKLGNAEPIVDDLATPELDLWADHRGLVKIHPNLLGL